MPLPLKFPVCGVRRTKAITRHSAFVKDTGDVVAAVEVLTEIVAALLLYRASHVLQRRCRHSVSPTSASLPLGV